MKTATSEVLMARTVKPVSRAPRRAASKGGTPCCRYRATFSITTIASSTTNPVQIVSAIIDRLSML